jgi:hypothetical protein
MRLVIAVLAFAACGGSPKPAPPPVAAPVAVAAVEAPPPETPPPPPTAPKPDPKPEQVAVNTTGDPCEGGEATPRGGGDGIGMPGLGTYGTIGHGSGTGGSGTGSGIGGLRGRHTAASPTIKLGEATVKGDLDKAIIRRYVKRNIQKLQYCYEKELIKKSGLAGKLVAKWTINDQGKTEDVATPTTFDPDVGACVVTVFTGIEFPKPKSGTVAVSYPFTFATAAP